MSYEFQVSPATNPYTVYLSEPYYSQYRAIQEQLQNLRNDQDGADEEQVNQLIYEAQALLAQHGVRAFPGGGFPGFPGLPGTGLPGTPGMPDFTGGQQGGGYQAPTSPPPSTIPPKPYSISSGVAFVDPGAISGCLFRFTYVWLTNGDQFWFFPTFVGPQSIAGFRYNIFGGWRYFGIDLRFVDAFTCS